MTQTDAVLKAWLDRAKATGGPYDPTTIFMGLYTAVTNRGALTALSDVTEATGAMATRQAVTPWGTSYKQSTGLWVADGPPLTFSPASSAETQTIAGFFLASLITAGVLKAFKNVGPYLLPDETRRLTIVPRLTIDPSGTFDISVVWNG